MTNLKSSRAILPVMSGFFIMGFVDIVGVATNYVKADFTGMDDKKLAIPRDFPERSSMVSCSTAMTALPVS